MKWVRFEALAELRNDPPTTGGRQISLEMIESATGRIGAEGDTDYPGGSGFTPGDTIFGKLRPYLAKVWLADQSGNAIGDFHVYRPRARTEPRFLYYVVLSSYFIEAVNAATYGVKMPRADWQEVRNIPVPLIPVEEQRQIADFLDRETAQIDATIAAMRELVVLIQERLAASWDGELARVNVDYPRVAIRRVASVIDGPFGSSLTSKDYVDDGVRVVRLGNIGVDYFKDADRAYISLDYGETLIAHEAREGDVVMAALGDERMPIGRTAQIPARLGQAIVKADCYRIRPIGEVSAAYLSWACSSPAVVSEAGLEARGSTRQRLTTGIAKSLRIPLPPLEAQVEITSRHGVARARSEEMIRGVTEAIALMEERRAAVISAAVTGRLDVETGLEREEGAA